jgi:peptidoglycan L-alanyl-D-glutamate endopeptidase CwlK
MSLVSEQAIFMRHLCQLIDFANKGGFVVTGGELYRTPEQQEIYVKTGKSKTSNSMHLKKCAIDLNFFFNGEWLQTKDKLQSIGDYWESLDPKNSWGGNWKSFLDCPHFERRVV